jgi:hypothetical protein
VALVRVDYKDETLWGASLINCDIVYTPFLFCLPFVIDMLELSTLWSVATVCAPSALATP